MCLSGDSTKCVKYNNAKYIKPLVSGELKRTYAAREEELNYFFNWSSHLYADIDIDATLLAVPPPPHLPAPDGDKAGASEAGGTATTCDQRQTVH